MSDNIAISNVMVLYLHIAKIYYYFITSLKKKKKKKDASKAHKYNILSGRGCISGCSGIDLDIKLYLPLLKLYPIFVQSQAGLNIFDVCINGGYKFLPLIVLKK